MTRSGRLPSASVARMSSTFVSAASSTGAPATPRRCARSLHLRNGFFARDVDDTISFCGERRRRLHQKRRLADAGIAADEDCRAAHEAAAGCTVEFGYAARNTRRVLDLARQCGERNRSALAWRAQALRPAADAAGRAFLDQRVPLAAGFALAAPARGDVAAGLADELDAGFSHYLTLPLAGRVGERALHGKATKPGWGSRRIRAQPSRPPPGPAGHPPRKGEGNGGRGYSYRSGR